MSLTHSLTFAPIILGIHFPTPYCEIAKASETLRVNIRVYVYDQDKQLVPLLVRKDNPAFQQSVNLLLAISEDGTESHYVYIAHLNRLLNSRDTGLHGSTVCPSCLHQFRSSVNPVTVREHIENCGHSVRIQFPKEKIVKFTDHHKTLRRPAV